MRPYILGSSGLFVIGDPQGKINKSTDSVQTTQSTTSNYSAVVGGELVPSKYKLAFFLSIGRGYEVNLNLFPI